MNETKIKKRCRPACGYTNELLEPYTSTHTLNFLNCKAFLHLKCPPVRPYVHNNNKIALSISNLAILLLCVKIKPKKLSN